MRLVGGLGTGGLNQPESRIDCLFDFFVLVLKEGQSISNVVPLAFSFTAVKACSEFVCELFRVLVLE